MYLPAGLISLDNLVTSSIFLSENDDAFCTFIQHVLRWCPKLFRCRLPKNLLGKTQPKKSSGCNLFQSPFSFPHHALNAPVIFAMATKHWLPTNTNILLTCLAGTDLLTRMGDYPVAIAVDIKRISGVGHLSYSNGTTFAVIHQWNIINDPHPQEREKAMGTRLEMSIREPAFNFHRVPGIVFKNY